MCSVADYVSAISANRTRAVFHGALQEEHGTRGRIPAIGGTL
nr:MAG TPA: hypothetical protein [Caudoviricetes sp.]